MSTDIGYDADKRQFLISVGPLHQVARVSYTTTQVIRKIRDDKILCIKLIRETTNCGLKEAKDFVDFIIDSMDGYAPGYSPTREAVQAAFQFNRD